MSTEIKVPVLPESVADATISKWHKKPGEKITRDETIVDVETDKVMLEVPAPADGVLEEILQDEGATVKANEVIGKLKPGSEEEEIIETVEEVNGTITTKPEIEKAQAAELSPAVRRLVAEHDIDIAQIEGTGKQGRISKADVANYLETLKESVSVAGKSAAKEKQMPKSAATVAGLREEKRVPMTRLRARIAERLLSAQQNMAILTTFNEVNMQAVMDLRKQYKEVFEKAHNVRLGFMSFFVRAATVALKRFPDVNAFIDGNDIVYHGYCDVGVAVSTERGLVVPVLRDADSMSMAEIEESIGDFANKAKDAKLTMEEMTGGTFTITNGGVFGSLLSTPILNPPQSAILGMHKIEQRAVVENGEIVARPMMYLALSYDHRIIDGKNSVQFLKTIKELLEDPARLLLDV